MSRAEKLTLNLSDVPTKRRFMQKIGSMAGLWDFTFKERKKTRSLDQNAYWWVACVSPFAEWLRETDGDNSITNEQAHIILKKAVLGYKEITSKLTGEVIELVPESKNLDTGDFAELIEGAAKWLADFAGIVVIDSALFFEAKAAGQTIDARIRA